MIRNLKREESIPYNLLLLADESREAIDKYIYDCEIYVAELNNAIIAVYALQVTNDETVEIKNIAVSEIHQGKGIGKKLLMNASIRAKENGYRKIIIGTGDASIRQLDLYQKAGFEIFGKKRNYFMDNYTELIFENGIQLKDMVMLKKLL
ncbi:MAG: ribosomal protein S18 acetylase RimI-like enzyme [Saprospiraceae bacterium]|jgi:ribosomal protein S18 acetylase RimI-like enzyme